jgi:tetratricopeptide (TPR) repeat protein
MLDVDAFQDFRLGLARLRDGDAIAAIELLRQAAKRDPENPYYLSYFGLGLGHAEGMWGEAERLCHRALCRGRRQAQLYLNLAEVYVASGRPQAASDTLAIGLRYMPHDARLLDEFSKLIMRRAPMLKVLPRSHALNRALGRLRHFVLLHTPRRRWLQVQPSQARAYAE